jgi:retinol-binding protein 3
MIRTTIRIATALALAGLVTAPRPARAQAFIRRDQPDSTVDAKARAEVVEGVLKHLDEAYVYPETARKMAAELREQLDKKAFDEITSAKEFARTLTERLQAVSKDKHLRVDFSYDPLPAEPPRDRAPDAERRERMRARGGAINFGFEKVERLEGNVGYLDLRGFFPAEYGGETAAAAMGFLAHTDALIIDLRRNGGGSPSMVALLCSYLFDPEPVHLNDLYFRPDDSTHQWWTLPYLLGTRYAGKPVYVLTSRRTFSAAEEFTYNLKCLKRATIVGETTGGGAHPGGGRRINDHFAMFVPSGRAINPITRTNWEGTGVAPDVAVPADLALKTAHLAAIEKIAGSLDDKAKKADPMRAEQIQKDVEKVRKELEDLKAKSKDEAPKGRED